jgi:hypothetical protein
MLFDEVADVVRGLVPSTFGALRQQPRRYGIKVWFDSETPTREHYEAQVIGKQHVADATVLAIEIGFHAEYPSAADSDAAMAPLLAGEKKWRRSLGADAVAGPFLGRADRWRRLSETWPDPDLGAGDLPFELGARLVDYITAIEPLRKTGGK